MSDKKVSQLTAKATLDGTEILHVVSDPSGTPVDRKATAQAIADLVTVPALASQDEAEDGVENTKIMTALRVAQAIAVQAPVPTIASQAEAEAGVENTKMMTALRTAQAIAVLGGGGNYLFYAALITQTGTSAPTIADAYTNLTGLTMTTARTGVGTYTLTPSNSAILNNSVRLRKVWNQRFATVQGFVEVTYLAGFPTNKIQIKTYNTSFALADDILVGELYLELLDNTL